jgi:glycosyltransferase involved in cell wall biosynthesis
VSESKHEKCLAFQPHVSIVMPVYNAEQTLYAAIRSIVTQTHQNWELLILDDGSTDESLRIAGGFCDDRIRILSDGLHLGIVARLNQALDEAKGEYVARMDSDDISYPYRLEKQLSYLAQNPNVDLVGSLVLVFGSGGRAIGKRSLPERHDQICAKPIGGFPMQHPTYLGRAEWFRRYKYRDEAVRCEDQDHTVSANSPLFRKYSWDIARRSLI